AIDAFLDLGALRVPITVRRLTALAAEQLIDGKARLAALDVPQRLVHAADRVVQHRAIAPVRAVIAGLPGVIDAVGRLAGEERLEIFLHSRNDKVRTLREGGATIAVKSRLIGGDLDNAQPQPGRCGGDHADVANHRRLHPTPGALDTLLAARLAARDPSGDGRSADRLEPTAPAHYFTPLSPSMLLSRVISSLILRSRASSVRA